MFKRIRNAAEMVLSESCPGNGSHHQSKAKELIATALNMKAVAANDDAPTFLTNYEAGQALSIKKAGWVVVDIETTNLTPQSIPIRVGNQARLANMTYAQYKKEYPGCVCDTRPRCRILTVGLPDGSVNAWDMDALPAVQQRQLAHDVISGKIIIGHNLGFDLAWLGYLTDAKPRRVLDSMIITKVVDHGMPLRLHTKATKAMSDATSLVNSLREGLAGYSLESCCIAAGLPRPDKSFQKPHNWTLSHLSPGHYDYVVGDVTEPLAVLRMALGLSSASSIQDIIRELDQKHYIYKEAYEPTLNVLAELQRKGMPVSLKSLDELIQTQLDVIGSQARELVRLAPEFEMVIDKISAPSGGLTAQIKNIFKAVIEAEGLVCPVTDKGAVSITSKSIKLAGILRNKRLSLIWSAWEALQGAKKRYGMLDTYRMLAEQDGCLHPLIGLNARTMRMTATEPNTQNFPRDAEFRAIVRGSCGDEKIISVDFGQIELRIAAALALRSVDEARGSQNPRIRKAIELAESDSDLPDIPTKEECGKSKDAWEHKFILELAHAWRDMLAAGAPLADVFRNGLDPHLLTAVETLRRKGDLVFSGSAIAYLQLQDAEALKQEYKDARQQAKAQDFGLLYAMSATGLYEYGKTGYDLDWSKQDAEEARDAWLQAYPDIRVWHAITALSYTHQYIYAQKPFAKFSKPESYSQKVFKSYTLAGRELVTTSKKDALNYSDQGSGADMLALAIAMMPVDIREYLINLIHDEMLFCVPANEAESIAQNVSSVMNQAGNKLLSPWGIPCETEVQIADVWKH